MSWCLKFQRMKDAADNKAEENRALFDGAKEKFLDDVRLANERFSSPGGNKGRMPYL